MTANFKKSEFNCKCGCDMPIEVEENIRQLANELQLVRNLIKKPIRINSGYRCESYNAKVGGVKGSQHVLGNAADIVIVGLTSSQSYDLLNRLQHSGIILTGGLGVYRTFVHYDIRGRRKRWNNKNG